MPSHNLESWSTANADITLDFNAGVLLESKILNDLKPSYLAKPSVVPTQMNPKESCITVFIELLGRTFSTEIDDDGHRINYKTKFVP